MKVVNGEVYYTIGEVSTFIKRDAQTIRNWYKWREQYPEEAPELKLPKVYRDIDNRGTRYFKAADIPFLENFKENINYGAMAPYSRTKWGKRKPEEK
jgi:hypothetical protein